MLKDNPIVTILVICMLAVFLPSPAFAASGEPQIQGMAQKAENIQMDPEKKYYTQLTLKPYTFYDVAGGSKKTLDDATITSLVKNHLLDDWVEIANGCFKTSGKCATINVENYDNLFNTSNPTDDSCGEIRDYLKDKAGAVNKGSKSKASLVKSGIRVASSLGSVRQAMADQIAGQISKRNLHGSDVLKKGGPGGSALKEMADDKTENNTVVYSIVTSIFPFSINDFEYNSFGIAFYDFHPCAIQAENLKYKSSIDGLTPEQIKAGAPGVSYESQSSDNTGSELTNDSGGATEGSVTRIESYESTLTNDFETASEKTFGQTINHSLTWGSDVMPWSSVLGHMETSVSFSFQEMYSTKEGHSTTETHKKETQTTQSVPEPPQTYISVTQGSKDQTLQSDYDTPVQVSYKVAIFSLTGEVYADGGLLCLFDTAGYEQGNYLNIIGGDSDTGVSANENLHLRAIENQSTGREDAESGGVIHRYWINHGGSNYNTTNVGTNWNSGYLASNDKAKAAVAAQATKIPMMSCGCKYAVNYKTNTSTLNEAVPLYLPARFVLGKGEASYEITSGGTMDLDRQLEINCLNRNNIPYFAFRSSHGQWIVCDYLGKPALSTCVDIRRDATGDQILTTYASGKDYITWKMNDDVEYLSKKDTGSITSKDNLPAPVIEINVKKEAFQGSVEVSGDFDGCVGDEGLNLNKILTAKAFDPTHKQVMQSFYWESENLPGDGITVESNGDIHLFKEGTYHVRAVVSNAGSGSADVYSDWFEITVRPARQLTDITILQPHPTGTRLMDSPATTEFKYDLLSYVRGFDQYGEPWTGPLEGVSFQLNGVNENACIGEDQMLCITGEGNCSVTPLLNGSHPSDESELAVSIADNLQYLGDDIRLACGKTTKIRMYDYNEKPLTSGLTFESREPAVASVAADGTVKALGVGSTQILVTDAGGGTENCMVTVSKGANPLKVKGRTVKVSEKKLRKKSQAITCKKAMIITGACGVVTYSKVSVNKKKYAKKFTVNSRNGKITVKKGLKKGTYKVSVKVKAAGNANYKASTWKTVTFKVRVR